MRVAAVLLLVAASAMWAPAQAQDRTEITQVTNPATLAIQPAQPAETSTEAPQQLSASAEASVPAAQLTASGSSGQQPAQVATRTTNPQPPEPLSTPQQGRTAAIDRVKGADRCDPGEGRDKASSECRKVIENRAAEYRRAPVTELSPEQKLLIDQQLRENAAQQLAKSGDPANNADAMGIASLVLNGNQPPKEPKKEEPAANSDAAVQAVISILQGTPSPQD